MVRQPQSKANAGAFNNGMPMTSSLGCGTWGGNITSENIHLKHYMNMTWVSRPIAEDRPSEQELFGEFYGTPRRLMSVLAKATEILDLVAEAPDGATLTSIAQRLGQPARRPIGCCRSWSSWACSSGSGRRTTCPGRG